MGRFDIPSMLLGIAIMAAAVFALLVYVSGARTTRRPCWKTPSWTSPRLASSSGRPGRAEADGSAEPAVQSLDERLVRAGVVGAAPVLVAGVAYSFLADPGKWYAGRWACRH